VILRDRRCRARNPPDYGNDQAQITDASPAWVLFTADLKALEQQPERLLGQCPPSRWLRWWAGWAPSTKAGSGFKRE